MVSLSVFFLQTSARVVRQEIFNAPIALIFSVIPARYLYTDTCRYTDINPPGLPGTNHHKSDSFHRSLGAMYYLKSRD